MSIVAVLLDQNMEPVSDKIVVKGGKFKDVEREAKKKAENGIKCCIRWSREADGEANFWGPNGYCLEPHWYVKQGRPVELKNGQRTQVYLDEDSKKLAKRLGGGNVSEGIRKALLGYAAQEQAGGQVQDPQ